MDIPRGFLALVLGFSIHGSACQKGEVSSADVKASDTPYRRDLGRICNALEQSGATEVPEGTRSTHVAIWLGQSLESQEARDLSAKLSQAGGSARIELLQSELKKIGMTQCPILALWQE